MCIRDSAYTVDQHILRVIRNLRRLTMPEYADELPFCTRLMARLDKNWLLYIAALFHDIAKGRGGSHSELGAVDAQHFCSQHNLPQEDNDLVCFLVREHLTMSSVAQRQDISDPQVISTFARKVGNARYLTALYLLTVCDIRGTSPKVWSAWKGRLLEDLYHLTVKELRGAQSDREETIQERQDEARRLLRWAAFPPAAEEELWHHIDDTSYFLRHSPDDLAWHVRHLHRQENSLTPIVRTRLSQVENGLQVLIYCRDRKMLFARLSSYTSSRGFEILDARVHTTCQGYALDTLTLYDRNQQAVSYTHLTLPTIYSV